MMQPYYQTVPISMIPLDLTQNHVYATQPQLQNLNGHKIADWFNNKFASGIEKMLAKD